MQEKNDPKLDEEPKKKQEWPETGKQGGEMHDDPDMDKDMDKKGEDKP